MVASFPNANPKMGRILNPKPVTLESLESNISCLVLLGEPGIAMVMRMSSYELWRNGKAGWRSISSEPVCRSGSA
jgi:hypothetical protein